MWKIPKYNMSLARCGEQVTTFNKHVHEFGPKYNNLFNRKHGTTNETFWF